MSDLNTLKLKLKKAEDLSLDVLNNKVNSYDVTPKRYYYLNSIACKIKKQIFEIQEVNRKNKVIPKKTIGELRAMVTEEKRAIKEAGFSYPLRDLAV